MLSAQCDELRRLAGDGSIEWCGPVRAEVLSRAADNIEDLSAKCAGLTEECERLRNLVYYMWYIADDSYLHILNYKELCSLFARMRELGIEVPSEL